MNPNIQYTIGNVSSLMRRLAIEPKINAAKKFIFVIKDIPFAESVSEA